MRFFDFCFIVEYRRYAEYIGIDIGQIFFEEHLPNYKKNVVTAPSLQLISPTIYSIYTRIFISHRTTDVVNEMYLFETSPVIKDLLLT